MDINSAYFKRISYKKNAIEEISNYIKFYHKHKNILYITTSSDDFSNEVLSQIVASGNSFRFCQVSGKLGLAEIKTLSSRAKESKLIVGYVDSQNSNLVKYLTKYNNADYIIIPSAPTSTLYFLPHYFSPINHLSCEKCDMPAKVFIDERVIQNCKYEEVLLGLNTINAYYEFYFTKMCELEILGQKFDTLQMSKLLSRYEDMMSLIKKREKDAKLVLMDNLIELGELTKQYEFSEISFFNLAKLLELNGFIENQNYHFEEYCTIASDLLLSAYRQLLLQKSVKQLAVPNYDEIAKLLEKYSIVGDRYKGMDFFEKLISNRELFMKINSVKAKMLDKLEKIYENFKKNTQILLKEKKSKPITLTSLESCYNSVKLLPFIFNNNLIVDVMCGTGILNF